MTSHKKWPKYIILFKELQILLKKSFTDYPIKVDMRSFSDNLNFKSKSRKMLPSLSGDYARHASGLP